MKIINRDIYGIGIYKMICYIIMINHDRNVRTRNRNDAIRHSTDNNGHSNACILLTFQLSRGDLTRL